LALAGVLLITGATLVSAAHMESYPVRPVKFIVPYPPGGGSDLMARTLGEKLQQRLGQPFVVENRGGASGNIGLELAARSRQCHEFGVGPAAGRQAAGICRQQC
jgi:tripartite-type tricarboxylate transporter receptor subunit TctC